MSRERQHHEALRWLTTAEEDLKAAEALQNAEMFSHCCFMAQQCAEKAVKALWCDLDEDPWGHSVQKLMLDLPADRRGFVSAEMLDMAAALDRFYIPARYPNGLPDLTPGATFHARDAEVAHQGAATILKAIRALIKG